MADECPASPNGSDLCSLSLEGETWDQALKVVCRGDSVLANVAERLGSRERLLSRGSPFQTLARAIVGQQISLKAADAVWARLLGALGAEALEPAVLARALAKRPGGLAGLGLSAQKQRSLIAIHDWAQQRPGLEAWLQAAPESEVRQALIALPGVGPWTADMVMIFGLMRPDVFAEGDLAVRRALGELYLAGETPSLPVARAFSVRWKPYRTVAAWLLWRHLDPKPVEY